VAKQDTQRDYRDKTVIITGGAGFIGSNLTDALVGHGAKVTVFDSFVNGKMENLSESLDGCEIITGDVRDAELVASLSDLSPDFIFDLAATPLLVSFEDPYYDLTVNAGGFINILSLARKSGAKIVRASTGSVYGNPEYLPMDEAHPLLPISPYAVSKLAGEHYANIYKETYGVEVCCLRYFNVYGPRQAMTEEMGVVPIFISRLLSGQPLNIYGSGQQSRDFLHVSDVVAGTLAAGLSTNTLGKVFNIGGLKREVKIIELANILGELLNVKPKMVFRDAKPGDIARLVAKSDYANRVFGYLARVELEDGLREYIEWFKSREVSARP